MKKIHTNEDCVALKALVELDRVRIVKEHTKEGPIYMAFSASGTPIGIIGDRYKYMFDTLLSERGSGDGLFECCSQTSGRP